MKKRYIQPTTKLHIVAVHQMLCGSPDAPIVDNGTSYNGDGTNYGKEDEDFDW